MRSGQQLINTTASETAAAAATPAESKSSIILFVTIQGSEQLQGVCKVSNHQLIEEVKEEWKQYWQGKFKSAINVTWLIPFCAMPIAKVNQFLQHVLAKKSSDFMVKLALSVADSYSHPVNEAELFNQHVRNLIEVPHEDGIQVSKSYVNW